ncbi:hypothetical protein D3C71_1932210 [compost metagenome]
MFNRYFLIELAFNIILCFSDHLIIVSLLSGKYGKGRLTLPVYFNLKYFRTENRSLPVVIFFYQINHQIQEGIRSSISINSIFVGNQLIRM